MSRAEGVAGAVCYTAPREESRVGSLPSLMPRLRRARAERVESTASAGRRAPASTPTVCASACARTRPCSWSSSTPHLPPGWRACASPLVDEVFSVWVDPGGTGAPRPSRVYAGRRRRARTTDLALAFAVLETEIRQSVAASAERRTFVHAGVVGWRGRAILVPGRSRSGKTTLVAELVKAGALYLSDEFAVLDGRGRVHPFAKPLSIRGPGGCDAHARAWRAEDLGGTVGTRPLPVGLVVLAAHRPGAAWRPERLSRGQAVLEMLAHTVPARLRPEASLVSLERAVAGATVLKGAAGRGGGSRAGAAAAARGAGAGLPPRGGREGDEMRPVARRDGLLIRELPGEVLVYDRERHRAHCLNQTAASVFRHADGTRTVADLARVLAPEAAPAAGASVVAHGPRPAGRGGTPRGRARDRGAVAPRRGPPRRHRGGPPAARGRLDPGPDPRGSGRHLRHELRGQGRRHALHVLQRGSLHRHVRLRLLLGPRRAADGRRSRRPPRSQAKAEPGSSLRDSSRRRQPSSRRCSTLWASGSPLPGSPGVNLKLPFSHARKA